MTKWELVDIEVLQHQLMLLRRELARKGSRNSVLRQIDDMNVPISLLEKLRAKNVQ